MLWKDSLGVWEWGLRPFYFGKCAITKQNGNNLVLLPRRLVWGLKFNLTPFSCWIILNYGTIFFISYPMVPSYLRLISDLCHYRKSLCFSYILFLSSCELWNYGYTLSTGMYDFVGCDPYISFSLFYLDSLMLKFWLSCKFLYPSLSFHVLNIRDLINTYIYIYRERERDTNFTWHGIVKL